MTRLIAPLGRNFTSINADFFKQMGLSADLTSNFIGDRRIDPALNVTDWFTGGGYYQFNRPSDDKQYKVNYSKVHGSHIFKAGADLAPTDNELLIEQSAATFTTLQTASPQSSGSTGNALASYLLGLPDNASRRNTRETMRWGGVLGFYFQDQWKATQNLTINFGLRYDRNFVPRMGRESDNNMYTGAIDFNRGVYLLIKAPPSCDVAKTAPCLPGGVLPDHVELAPDQRIVKDPTKNFQPRVGLAYRLRPGTAIRSGFGVVFDNWSGVQQIGRNFAGQWPSIGFVTVTNLNTINAVPTTKVENPLPSSVIPAASPFLTTGYYPAPDWKNAYSMQWNFGVQHQATASNVLSLYYVGSGTRRLDVGGLYNVATTPGPGKPSDRFLFPWITAPSNYTRPWGSANYHSLQFMAEGRYARGLNYRVSYTWSKSMDYGSSGFFAAEDYSVQNPLQHPPRQERFRLRSDSRALG